MAYVEGSENSAKAPTYNRVVKDSGTKVETTAFQWLPGAYEEAGKGEQELRPVLTEFEQELRRIISRFSMENHSNTPDFILAEYLRGCLDAFNLATKRREHWYGRKTF